MSLLQTHTKGVLFCQNLIFRDGYFSSFQFSYLTASSCSMRVTRFFALASLAQWIECQPTDWRVTGSFLVKGLYLGCRLPRQGSWGRQPMDVFLTWMCFCLFPSPLFLKINRKISPGENYPPKIRVTSFWWLWSWGGSDQTKDIRSHCPPSPSSLSQRPSIRWFDNPLHPPKQESPIINSFSLQTATQPQVRGHQRTEGLGKSWICSFSFLRKAGLWHILSQSAVDLMVVAPSPWSWEAFLDHGWAGRALPALDFFLL